MINNVFHKPLEENIQRSQMWRTWRTENGSLSSSPMIIKLPVWKGVNMKQEVRWHIICPENCSHRDMAKCFPSQPEKCQQSP
jgi:hypothetical protein